MEEKNGNLKIFVLDDEQDAVKRMEFLFEKVHPAHQVFSSTDPQEAIKKVLEVKPDLMFVDVEMPGLSGFDVVQHLQKQKLPLSFIFVTAFDQYAIKAIRSAAFDYLLKPVDVDELKTAISRYRQNGDVLNTLESEKLHEKTRFATRTGYIYLNPDDILWCEANGAYTKLYINDKTEHIISINLSRIQDELPAQAFYRIGRSGLINTKYLHAINRRNKTVALKMGNDIIELKASLKYLKGLME